MELRDDSLSGWNLSLSVSRAKSVYFKIDGLWSRVTFTQALPMATRLRQKHTLVIYAHVIVIMSL